MTLCTDIHKEAQAGNKPPLDTHGNSFHLVSLSFTGPALTASYRFQCPSTSVHLFTTTNFIEVNKRSTTTTLFNP